MKTPQALFALSLGLLAPAILSAAHAPKPAPRAEVNFFEPAKFTDVKDSAMDTDNERGRYKLDQLRDYLVDQAAHLIPDGQFLSVTFTDVDLAGDFEPWRGPQWDDVRIVKDIYPPRIKLAFRLTDQEGNVLKQGDRDLRDLAFLDKITMAFQDDPLRHEKALLDDWLRSEFPRAKTK